MCVAGPQSLEHALCWVVPIACAHRLHRALPCRAPMEWGSLVPRCCGGGGPSLHQPHSPARGRTPSEAGRTPRLSHRGGPEPHRAVTGAALVWSVPRHLCHTEGGLQTPGLSKWAPGLLSVTCV